MRITSRDGNVIATDFRPRSPLDISVTIQSEILFQDDVVILTRTTGTRGGKVVALIHLAGNLQTGQVTQI